MVLNAVIRTFKGNVAEVFKVNQLGFLLESIDTSLFRPPE